MIFVKPWIRIRIRNYSLTGWPARARKLPICLFSVIAFEFPARKAEGHRNQRCRLVAYMRLSCLGACMQRISARVQCTQAIVRIEISHYITKIKYESKWFHCSQKLLIFFPHDIYFMILNIQQYGRNITNSNNPVPW